MVSAAFARVTRCRYGSGTHMHTSTQHKLVPLSLDRAPQQGMRVLQCGPMQPPLKAESTSSKTPCMELTAGVSGLDQSACIACGQCTVFCPTGAIRERDATPQVMAALQQPGCTVVLQVAPSVRITLAEAFGGAPGQLSAGQLAAAAR
jgi:ferredoxin